MLKHDVMDTTDTLNLERLQLRAALLQLPDVLKTQMNEGLTIRYLCLIGLLILIYDHTATFRAERRLMWTSPASLAKFGFYINRYLVPMCIFTIFIPLSGYVGLDVSNLVCQAMLVLVSLLMTCSITLANGLVVMRVITLWEHRPWLKRGILSGYWATYATSIGCYAVSMANPASSISWNSFLHMCTLTKTSGLMIPAWAAPIIFELVVLAALSRNTDYRSRQLDDMLAAALRRNGLAFYAVMLSLRVVQTVLVIPQKPGLLVVAAFLIWSIVTTITSRTLMAWRRIDIDESSFLPGGTPYSESHFGLNRSTRTRVNASVEMRLGRRLRGDSVNKGSVGMDIAVGTDPFITAAAVELVRVVEVRKWEDTMGVRRDSVRPYQPYS